MKYKLPFREGLSSLILAGVLSGCVSSRPKINYLPLEQDSRRVEEAQEKESFTPTYSVISESGPDHAKFFEIGVYLNGKLIAQGQGSSKQEAEERAAEKALKAKGWKK